MAKEIIFKTKEGVTVSFSLKQIILKGENVITFPSGERWSTGTSQPYVYGESQIAMIPDEMMQALGDLLIPKDIEVVEESGVNDEV